MTSKLKKVEYLWVFNDCILEIRKSKPVLLNFYLGLTANSFVCLAELYAKRPMDQQALFCYVLANLELNLDNKIKGSGVYDLLSELSVLIEDNFLRSPSVYVRENAFRAIVSLGVEYNVVAALNLLSEHRISHSSKLLADGLLKFSGDKQKLADRLVSQISHISPEIQCAIINYLRLLPADAIDQTSYMQQFSDMLRSNHTDKEVCIALIRFFQKYPFLPVQEILLNFLECDEKSWEFAAVSALSLCSYPHKQTITALEKALHSHNWYVRLNAAESLLNLDVKVAAMEENYYDLYASEMVIFRETVRTMKDKIETLASNS